MTRLPPWLMILALLCQSTVAWAGDPAEPALKTDLLLVVAHPDDETAVSGFLARAIFDQKKRVAVVYTVTDGSLREIEARRGLATLGVQNVWFIGRGGNGSQDVLRSIGNGHYGAMLESLVRLIRLTQPEVVLTWLPALLGDHGEHQAAGVLATEAFNLSGDATVFPAQLAQKRNDGDINKYELQPWQSKKIYYFTDGVSSQLAKSGPAYSILEVSPARGRSYLSFAAEEASAHSSQGDIGPIAQEALANGTLLQLLSTDTHGFALFPEPIRLIRGKSHVAGAAADDVFANIDIGRIKFTPPIEGSARCRPSGSLELDGAWGFYERFWRKQDIALNCQLIPPEIGIQPGQTLFVPLLLRNETSAILNVALKSDTPPDWKAEEDSNRYAVPAHGTLAIRAWASPLATGVSKPADLRWTAEADGRIVGTVVLRAYTLPSRLPE
jgi:LmbE family N-acetylglucosaminyl deacetylase